MKVSILGKVLLGIICFSSLGYCMEKDNPEERRGHKRKHTEFDSDPRRSKRLNPSYIEFPERPETIRQLFNQAPGSDHWGYQQTLTWKIHQSTRNLINAFNNSKEIRIRLTFNPYAHSDGGVTYGARGHFSRYVAQQADFNNLQFLAVQLIPRASVDFCNDAVATWKTVIEKAPKLKKVVLTFNIAEGLLRFIPKTTHVDIDCEGYIDMDLSIINPKEAALENRAKIIRYCQQNYPAEKDRIKILPLKGNF